MKIHTTNYKDTFIEVADDCPATVGEIPPTKENTKSVANIQFEMVTRTLTNTLRTTFCFRCLPTKTT